MAEKLFLNSEEYFEDFCNNANDLMQSVTPEGRFRWVNKAWLETLGYNEKQIANMTVFDIIHPDELEHCQQLFKKIMSGEDVSRITTAFVTKDGNKIIVEGEVNSAFSQDKPIYTRAIFRNITERKQAEEALKYERDFAQGLMNTAQAIVLVLDTEARISYINPYMEEISGYHLEEVKGKDWFATFLPKHEREKIKELFLTAIGDTQTRGNINTILTKDGQERDIEWYDKTLKDPRGNVTGLLAIGQDITERKKAEEELKESEERYRAMINLGGSVGEAIILRQDTERG